MFVSIPSLIPLLYPSLTKDMTGKEDGYRATAIRSLCKITDLTMLTAIERYLKQALVDRNPAVSSAALVSTLHLGKDNGALQIFYLILTIIFSIFILYKYIT